MCVSLCVCLSVLVCVRDRERWKSKINHPQVNKNKKCMNTLLLDCVQASRLMNDCLCKQLRLNCDLWLLCHLCNNASVSFVCL